MNRNQTVLIALLALQMVVILLARSPFTGSTGSTPSHRLLPELDSAVATRLELVGDGDRALVLDRVNENWVLGDLGGFPVDATKIEDLVEKLAELEVRLPVVSSSRYHKAFELTDDENLGRLRLYGADSDDPAVDLILGNSPNYRVMNVRRADADEVYEVRGLAAYDVSAEPGFWAEKQLVEVAETDLVGIKLTNAAGTLELARQDATWKIVSPTEFAETPLDETKVAALVSAVRSIRIDQPIGPVDDEAHGFQDAAVVVELSRRSDSAEDTTVEILTYRIGDKVVDKDSQRYVSRTGFGFTGTIWESSISEVLEQTPADLVGDAS